MGLSARTLSGNKVKSPKGDDLGKIEDFVIDVDHGRVDYAVLSFGGFLGMGDKLFAIPLQAMSLDPKRKCFILNVEEKQLKEAPGFDKDHWPNTADVRWHRTIHDYYGVAPRGDLSQHARYAVKMAALMRLTMRCHDRNVT